jgi:hypothetical protein
MNLSDIKPIFFRGVSVALRLLFVLLIPKLLLENEYNTYSLLNSLVVFVTSASGFGFPVYFIKKYALNEISREYYLRYITPISLISGILLYVIFAYFLPINVSVILFIKLLIITLSEIYVLDFLRLLQADSNVYNHIKVSFYKSLLLIIIFIILFFFDKNVTLNKVLLSWLFSNILTVFYLSHDYKKVLNFKSSQKVFTSPIIIFSLFYFASYLFDRFILYYDKVIFFKHFDAKLMISLNLIILITQSSYNLIESTLLLKKYNNIFNNKYIITKKDIFQMLLIIFSFSILVSFFLFIYYKEYFGSLQIVIKIFFCTLFFYIVAILSWFYNILNYSQFGPKTFVIISLIAAILYLTFIYTDLLTLNSIYIIPFLYPLAYLIVNKLARVVLLH